ncbi:MAG: hypothetical protein JXA99_17285 [Candidatus Lokiarchaeota archaeon]|nr:hypothetical protein [Candidatus Lokiarchaeota archaeon]
MDIQQQKDFIENCKKHLKEILSESGAVLYSSGETLKKGDYYILGLNPGGNEGPTIKTSLDEILTYKDNAYLDENWSNKNNYGVGGHPLQRNMQKLSKYLNFKLREVCASNLIFVRSKNQNQCDRRKLAGICWEVHKLILKIVKPKVLIVFGKETFDIIRYKQIFDDVSDLEPLNSGHGKWKCYFSKIILKNREILLIGLPHLSRYTIPEKEIMKDNPQKVKMIQKVKTNINNFLSK